ncbi:cytokine receptor-like isoform X1 [Penaeus japonicus]|uniref:cytokine receptor-like isoform X1 n=1 Tax=Penaeus japonicus TaxID=27405 RepID=UPI001C70F588|nr:cytokine receptor-like isoform X1 [Penaeus japonicus]XP_042869509.1 cytokine receptor-like isoform X2 [Penaeus japonicus]XP_042869510.1 cytokine receptor-like isoform X1 [Penaeus japonicus]
MRPLSHTSLFEVFLLVMSALHALPLDTSCLEGETSCNSTQQPWISTTAGMAYECYQGSSTATGMVILPFGELTAEVGKPYDVTCLIDPELGLQAEDVEFTFDGVPIPETEIGDNRIEATITSEQQGQYNLVCKHDSNVCWRKLRTGYPPLDVENLNCISRNWQALECNWTIPENAAHPSSEDYNPYLTDTDHYDEPCEQQLGCQSRDRQECCLWTNATYSPSAKHIQVYFVTKNPLGNATFKHNFNNFAIVLPNPPEEVTAEEQTPLGILVSWQTPFPLRKFPPGLVYRVDYRGLDVQTPPGLAEIGTYGNSSGRWEKEIAVRFPGITYEFELRLRSGDRSSSTPDQWEDGFSSAAARVTLATQPVAPWTTPEVGVGTFQVKRNENLGVNKLVVAWRRLPRLLHNGPGLRYVVNCPCNNTIVNKTTQEPSATFTCLFSDQSYRVTIRAQNDLGPSSTTSEVVVGTRLPAAPVLPVVVFHRGQGHYELRWRKEEGLSYTVYTCTEQVLPEEPCQGDLSWKNVGKVWSVNVTLQEMNVSAATSKVYFALSAETGDNASSGMSWDRCVTPQDYNTQRTSPTVHAVDPKSNSVDVSWGIGCYGRAGVIEELQAICCHGYNTTQCPEDATCRKNQTDVDSGLVVLGGLQPSTNYTVRLRLRYRSGLSEWSDPVPFTTENPPESPTLAPWLIAVIASGSIVALVVAAVGASYVGRKIIDTHRILSRPIVLPQGSEFQEEDKLKPQSFDYQWNNITTILRDLDEANVKSRQEEDLSVISKEILSRFSKKEMDVFNNDEVPHRTGNADNANQGGLSAYGNQSADNAGVISPGYVLAHDPAFSQSASSQASHAEDEETMYPVGVSSDGYVMIDYRNLSHEATAFSNK